MRGGLQPLRNQGGSRKEQARHEVPKVQEPGPDGEDIQGSTVVTNMQEGTFLVLRNRDPAVLYYSMYCTSM